MGDETIKVAILGSGNIGTDLMYKLLDHPGSMELVLLAGIDPHSEGLARARDLGVATSDQGIAAVLERPEIQIVFDATSAKAHVRHAKLLRETGRIAIDLTPAARGPYVVPPVNLTQHLDAPNVNLITCGGQATIPLVYAVSRVTPVCYAEIVSTVASRSAGPGTRSGGYRRRAAGEGDYHPQPGGTADPDAEYSLCHPGRRFRSGAGARFHRGDGC
jgi:acetaldehyde dehydrogenase